MKILFPLQLSSVKNIIPIVLLISGTILASPSNKILGDVNDDGKTDIVDALVVAQTDVGINDIPVYLLSGDVNGDLMVNIVDALLIAQFSVESITEFPIESQVYEFQDPDIALAVRSILGKQSYESVSVWELRTVSTLKIKVHTGTIFSDVKNMLGLNTLDFSNSSNIDLDKLDLDPFIGLVPLQSPINPKNTQITVEYPCFTRLNLNNTGCTTIQKLTTLPQLTALVLSNNSIIDFNPLSALSNLEELDLTNTGFEDVDPLAGLTKMVKLNISRNNISKVNLLQNMTSLNNLNLSNNDIENNELRSLEVLNSLLTLNINRNYITDITTINNFNSLQMVDVRNNPIGNIDAFESKLRLRQMVWLGCVPGDLKGDANGDGNITQDDVEMVREFVVRELNEFYSPDNIECLDMNADGTLDEIDLNSIEALVGSNEGELYTIPDPSVSMKGDVDGDGTVTLKDADLLEVIPEEVISASEDFSHIDMDSNGQINDEDVAIIRNRVTSNTPLQAVVKTKENTINVLTFDHDLQRFGSVTSLSTQNIISPLGGDPVGIMPHQAIVDIHNRIINSPLLEATDVIVLPEYAYADARIPVELKDNGIGAHPRFEITNNNWIISKIHELKNIAAEKKVNIMVPVIERVYYNETVPISVNGALVINLKGEIEYVRRKTTAILASEMPEGADDFCEQLENNSHEVMELTTRDNVEFTSILVICAEMTDDVIPALYRAIKEYVKHRSKKTIDLLLFSEIITRADRHVEMQNRIQNGTWKSEYTVTAVDQSNAYIPLVDFLGYSGGLSSDQGVFSMTEIPEAIESVYANQFDNKGYVFSRFVVKRP